MIFDREKWYWNQHSQHPPDVCKMMDGLRPLDAPERIKEGRALGLRQIGHMR